MKKQTAQTYLSEEKPVTEVPLDLMTPGFY